MYLCKRNLKLEVPKQSESKIRGVYVHSKPLKIINIGSVKVSDCTYMRNQGKSLSNSNRNTRSYSDGPSAVTLRIFPLPIRFGFHRNNACSGIKKESEDSSLKRIIASIGRQLKRISIYTILPLKDTTFITVVFLPCRFKTNSSTKRPFIVYLKTDLGF